jgi:hypothetical protein
MKRRNFISAVGSVGLGVLGVSGMGMEAAVAEGADMDRELHGPMAKMPRAAKGLHDPVAEGALMISVKVIKEKAQLCSGAAGIGILSDRWSFNPKQNDHGDFYGENLREVYFNIESKDSGFSPATIKIHIPGAKAARVIVGYTDVLFEQAGDTVQFELVDDRSRGQLMQMMYQSPWGGYPIAFIHNWGMRKSKEYASEEFPAVKFASVHNYLLATQEVLRQMGNMGPEGSKPFKGEISLMGSEVAGTRGHVDYPPHVHIMHYEFGKEVNGEKEWKSRLVPHLYMDESGNIVRNKYDVIVGKGERSKEYGPGETVSFADSEGKHIMDLTIIDKGGLVFGLPDGRKYSIHPDPERGAPYAVAGYFNDEVICRARVKDYPDIGTFRIHLEKIEGGKVVRTLDDGYLYDLFTPHKFRNLYS